MDEGALKALIGSLTDEERDVVSSVIEKTKERRPQDPLSLVSILASLTVLDVDELISLSEKGDIKEDLFLTRDFKESELIPLEKSSTKMSQVSFEEVISSRFSVREFTAEGMRYEELSSILHYSLGVRRRQDGLYDRKAYPLLFTPTAGGLCSPEVYVVVLNVKTLSKGLYHFNPEKEGLELLERGLFHEKISKICGEERPNWFTRAGAILLLSYRLDKLSWKYGTRAYKLAQWDAGVLAGQIHLEATAMDLGSCIIASPQEDLAGHLLGLEGQVEEEPSLGVVVGKRRM